jgi:Ca2+-binding EF-hand superfamily protein
VATKDRGRGITGRAGMRSIQRWLGLVLVAAACAVAADLALAQPASRPDCLEDFRTADRNGDGRIDREEFHQRVVEQFFLIDKGRKGYLVREELIGVTDEAFKAANRKGDGRLTLQEFVNARFVDFAAADLNGDGVLTLEEIRIFSRC